MTSSFFPFTLSPPFSLTITTTNFHVAAVAAAAIVVIEIWSRNQITTAIRFLFVFSKGSRFLIERQQESVLRPKDNIVLQYNSRQDPSSYLLWSFERIYVLLLVVLSYLFIYYFFSSSSSIRSVISPALFVDSFLSGSHVQIWSHILGFFFFSFLSLSLWFSPQHGATMVASKVERDNQLLVLLLLFA